MQIARRWIAAAVLVAAHLSPSLAGDGAYEPDDDHEHGVPFFGEVKDIRSFEPVANALIRLQQQGTQRFIVFHADSEGRFRRTGLGPEVDPEKIDVTCEKAGYRTLDVLRRRLSTAKDAPVEVECLLERN